MTLGSQTRGQTTLTRRRLAAGEVQTWRRLRDSSSGDQRGGGGHLRVAGSNPRRLVVEVKLGVAGNDTGNELCGCRGTGEVGPVVVVILEAQGQVLRGLRDEVNSLGMVACPLGGRSIVDDELGGGACGDASCSRYDAREREWRGWRGAGA